MHSDRTSIQLRDHLRATLADKVAEFEARHGPVQTMPLINRGPITTYNGRVVDAEHAAARAKGAAVQRKPTRGTRQARNAAVLREVWP